MKYPSITKMSCKYGAPMGRSEWGTLENVEDRSLHLFHLPLDCGGYDAGGAYWGLGKPLFCAVSGEDYRRFTRASSRKEAITLLGIKPSKLIRKG